MGEDKSKLAKDKDDLQKQLMQQKDRLLEAERESSGLKSSLAGIEGEAGGQAKGETKQLQKSLRDLTTNSKIKDAEIQKLRDVRSLSECVIYVSLSRSRTRNSKKARPSWRKQRLARIKHYKTKTPNSPNKSTARRYCYNRCGIDGRNHIERRYLLKIRNYK